MIPQYCPWGLRVNVDADEDEDADVGEDGHVETLQTIVVKPLWIDNVANGGRPPNVFQQEWAPSHKAVKRWGVDGKEVEKHAHNTKSSSQMEAKDRGMETDMNEGHLMKARIVKVKTHGECMDEIAN
ncbi:hypothetical protein ACTXT7_008917 [Hymenolepis weldensis]